MLFNINDNVKVQLTDFGRRVHRENHNKFWSSNSQNPIFPYTAPKEDESGWSTWQLWNLINSFGEHLNLGCEMPFNCNIELMLSKEFKQKEKPMPKKYWMVMRDETFETAESKSLPRKKYFDKETAFKELGCLARNNPGVTFTLLEAVHQAVKQEVVYTKLED